jgi:hypothetical protein
MLIPIVVGPTCWSAMDARQRIPTESKDSMRVFLLISNLNI